mmetsp:Transcript_2240/g.6778  ORF Transcript_2240/g.6778 Transcript_2240/m.6778 type:complete len:240 (+) Transcript_2240:1772-2491(+)
MALLALLVERAPPLPPARRSQGSRPSPPGQGRVSRLHPLAPWVTQRVLLRTRAARPGRHGARWWTQWYRSSPLCSPPSSKSSAPTLKGSFWRGPMRRTRSSWNSERAPPPRGPSWASVRTRASQRPTRRAKRQCVSVRRRLLRRRRSSRSCNGSISSCSPSSSSSVRSCRNWLPRCTPSHLNVTKLSRRRATSRCTSMRSAPSAKQGKAVLRRTRASCKRPMSRCPCPQLPHLGEAGEI